ncbi:Topoisomerase 1-associated factor 1 [Malassezia caprae]|uniref:Topoisomerase 1-associated factor 1 n=1 Tax=Malassezia caprae TaxID=1381934 RepID=A0AAF0E575_9BASI|nr:Topoisomerase 1-associated factor 1 [Malassezia caprae]
MPADEAWDDLDAYASDMIDELAESVGSISEDDEAPAEPVAGAEEVDMDERVALLRPPILSICAALGGYEHVEQSDGCIEVVYKVGDDCLGTYRALIPECLRDLRRLWRQDDTDASRAIARVFAELGTLQNDLIPILLHCAGQGEKADKIALACTDLMTALTWPIDWQAELRDIETHEEDEDVLPKLLELQSAQVQYKASILRTRAKDPKLAHRTVLHCVLHHVLIPSLARPRGERTERDTGTIGLCLHLVRNLLSIRDPVPKTLTSTDAVANATLQSVLVQQMETTHLLDTLHMLASHADTKEYEAWAPVVADCVYQMYMGSDVRALAAAPGAPSAAAPSAPSASDPLAQSLAAEAEARRVQRPGATKRHSRFGTTIQYTAHDGTRRVARQPASLTAPLAQLEQRVRERSQRQIHRRRPATERGAPPTRVVWTPGARAVLQAWADRFVRDGIFVVLSRAYLSDIHAERERVGDLDAARCKVIQLAAFFLAYVRVRELPWRLVSTWLEPWAFRLVRARAAIALEGRQWLEFVASVRLWTVLLRAVDAMAHGAEEERAWADELQQTLYYDGDALDAALQVMHAYSAQSFACLEAIIDFSYTLPRMLERHAQRHTHMFVQRRAGDDDERRERAFRFASFQRAMATSKLAHACTQYLVRWRDSARPAEMLPRLAAVVHRIVVRCERMDLFFGARVRQSWARALTAPRDAAVARVHPQAARDLTRLHKMLARSFARLDGAAQAAYEADRRPPRAQAVTDVYVQSDLTHGEQIGVAVGLLAEAHKLTGVSWVRTALERAAAERMALGDMDALDPPEALRAQFAPHTLPDGGLDAAQCAPLRLLCRLVGLHSEVRDDVLVWYVPATAVPGELVRDARLIDQYLAAPLVKEGCALADFVHRLRPPKPASRKRAAPPDDTPAPTKRAAGADVPALSSGSSPPTSSPRGWERAPSPPAVSESWPKSPTPTWTLSTPDEPLFR